MTYLVQMTLWGLPLSDCFGVVFEGFKQRNHHEHGHPEVVLFVCFWTGPKIGVGMVKKKIGEKQLSFV